MTMDNPLLGNSPEVSESMENKEWTVMIYMSGENNLSADMVYSMQKLRQMAKELSNINLFVYYDGYAASVPTLYCDFSDPNSDFKYYRAHKIEKKLYSGERKFDENSAEMRSIANFVDWCVNRVEHSENGVVVEGRKANRYAFIFSGHSMGFQSIGLLKDESSGYYMTMKKLKWMFERLTKKPHELERIERERATKRGYAVDMKSARWTENTTQVVGQKFDILGFDSCVMGMLEVGYQFRSVAKTLIASEGSIPNAGWTYAEILGSLASQSSSQPTLEIARDFVRQFIRVQDRNTLGGVTVDMSAWDLRALHDLEEPFLEFTHALLACFEKKGSVTYSQMRRLLTYVHWRCQSYMFEQNVDLGDLCQLLIDEIEIMRGEAAVFSNGLLEAVAESSRILLKAVRSAVLISGFSGGKYQFSNGISLFFPWSLSSYGISQPTYEDLIFVQGTECGKKWNEFLMKYVGEVSLRKSKQVQRDPLLGKVYLNHYFAANQIGGIGDVDGRVPEDGTNKIPEDGTSKIPEDGTSKIPEDGTLKIPEDGTSKIPEDGTSKIPEDGTSKIPEDGTSKIPEDGTSKHPYDPSSKGETNGLNKVPENGTDKIPENGTDKIFGQAGQFFQHFMNCKNIQMFWNVSGISIDDAFASELEAWGDGVEVTMGIVKTDDT